jgi:hypothetical protein
MRIGLIIAEFESSFSSSFKHTARVQFNVDFDSSEIQNIIEKLKLLKNNIETGRSIEIHVGWQMDIKHVHMLESLLNQILDKYEEIYYYRPTNLKIYVVNNKLRESEIPALKDFTLDAIKELLVPISEVKISKKEKQIIEANVLSYKRAFKANQKL